MATAATAYGERRFGAAYTVRIVLALVLIGTLVGLWSGQTNPRAPSHPGLFWLSIGLIAVFAALWIVLGKTVLIINDAGVRRESFLGQQELTWSQIAETRYCVVPVNIYAHFGLIGALVAMSSKSGRAQLTLQLISGEGKKLKVTSAFQKADEAIGIILSRILPPNGPEHHSESAAGRDSGVRGHRAIGDSGHVEKEFHSGIADHQGRASA